MKGCKTGNGVNEDVTGALLELFDVKSARAMHFKECVAATHSLAFKTRRPTRRLFCLCVNARPFSFFTRITCPKINPGRDMGVTDGWINLAITPLIKNRGKWFNMVVMLK